MAHATNYNRFLLNAVLAHAKPGDRILDFGAGIGTFSRPVRERGYDVVCIEADPAQASRLEESGLTVRSTLDEIADESIDYAFTLNVLEHIEDDVAALREIFAKLKPAGRLLIYVPAFRILFSAMDRRVGHFRRYTRNSLAQAARSAGFTVNTTRYCDSLGFFATLIYKLAGDKSGGLNPRSLALYDRFAFPLSHRLDSISGPFFGKNALLIGEKRS